MPGARVSSRTDAQVVERKGVRGCRFADWGFLGLGPAPAFLARTTPVASIVFVALFLVLFGIVGCNDCPYDYLSPISGEMAEHHRSGNLMCWFFTASMFLGLIAMALLECRSLVAGLVAAVLVAVATGGFYVAGYVQGGFAVCAFVGVVTCALTLLLLGRPLMAVGVGVVSVFICMQLAFCLAQAGAFGEPPGVSPQYSEIMGLASEPETSEGTS